MIQCATSDRYLRQYDFAIPFDSDPEDEPNYHSDLEDVAYKIWEESRWNEP